MAQNSHDSGRKCGDVSVETSKCGVDWITNLPEEIICHILSFLPTRDAVATTLVSPKLLNLWKNITTLRFSHHAAHKNTSLTKFAEFVDMVFVLLESRCIDKLSIELSGFDSWYTSFIMEQKLCDWIGAAVAKNVKSFELSNLTSDPWFELGSCIFACNSLEILELRNIIVNLSRTSSVRLPNLRVLRIETDKRLLNRRQFLTEDEDNFIIGNECVGKIVSGCPSLHTLYLRSRNDKALTLSVCSPTLQHLTIISSSLKGREQRIKIDAPALKYLHIKHIKLKYLSIKTSSQLIVAEISLGEAICEFGIFDDLVQALSNVRILVLDVSDSWLLTGTNSLFPNLTSLTLCNFYNEVNIVKKLLQKSPTLETLCLKCITPGSHGLFDPNEIPRYVSPFRKTVKVEDFYGEIDQLRVLKLILRNTNLLETTEIVTDTECIRKLERLQISKFRRKSEYCIIECCFKDLVKISKIASRTLGFEQIAADKNDDKDDRFTVTLIGAMDMNALVENVKKVLGTRVEIVTPRIADIPPQYDEYAPQYDAVYLPPQYGEYAPQYDAYAPPQYDAYAPPQYDFSNNQRYAYETGYYGGRGQDQQFHNHYGTYQSRAMFSDAPQMLSDEKQNACVVM